MINRCYNPKRNNYPYYGGKGIQVCEEWLDFDSFITDVGERPEGSTLDRINSSEGYYKENCRWVSMCEQRMNRSRFSNSSRKYKGVAPHGNKWKAEIRFNGTNNYLGLFDTELEAAKAYDEKLKEFYPDTHAEYSNLQGATIEN